ncbi:right-handed parallel beta-helix repeat-containing protein [Akkermansiaceae bacterium]|nr:right-handed parallel beta-helix repeat-containing protein [Akkermansiaceae bacterium]
MKFPESNHIAFSRHVAWAMAAMAIALAGCREATEELPATVPAGQSADLRALIDAELAAGKKRIVIPPGRYHVKAQRGNHLHLKDLRDVEIIADDVEMICTSTIRAVTIENCSNLTIRGLAVDYDPLPFTQGKIIAIAPDKSWIDFEIAGGYPENELEERIEIYDAATGELRRGDARWDQEIQPLGERRYRVKKTGNYRFDPLADTERVGDILVTNNNHGTPGPTHAFVIESSRHTRFEDIRLYASPCFGFLEKDCHASRYIRCTIDRRPASDDPAKRALPRMRSLNADAFHSKDAAKGPAIISCTAKYQGDDCVNINGGYHYVCSSKGRQLRIAVLDKPRLKAGDPVEFLPHHGPRPPDAVATRVELDPNPLTDVERAKVESLRMDERTRERLLSAKAKFYTLTLDREVVLPDASAVCNPLRLGSGFAIKDCDFGHNRSRGILIKASDGEITGNRIIGSRMAAVLVSPEFWWMEGGISSNLTVRGNTIRGSLQTPIQILAPGGNGRPLPAGARRNISILGNRIEDCPWPLIRVTSTSDLTIEGNILPKAPPGQVAGSDGKAPGAILLQNCDP